RRGAGDERREERGVRVRQDRREARGRRGQPSLRDGAAVAGGHPAPGDAGGGAEEIGQGPLAHEAAVMRPAADLTPLARDVMKLPASVGLIFFSFVAAYLAYVLPWSGTWLLA